MPTLTLADLDQRPDLIRAVLAMFAPATPGIDHLVCGIPSRMGLPPGEPDLEQAAGVLMAVNPGLAVCTLASFALVLAFSRYVSLASIVAAAFAPFYEALIDTHRDLSEPQSHALNARLVLLLANHIGLQEVLLQALQAARDSGRPD